MRITTPTNQTAILRKAATIALLCSVAGNMAFAADKTWDGEGANDFWQTAANWDPVSGGSAPVANDLLTFDGSTRLTPANNFTAGTIFNNIAFGGSASGFTLGGNSVTLTNPLAANYLGGLNAPYTGGSISNLSSVSQAINLPLVLANGHHNIIGNAGGGTLSLSGSVTLGSAASASFSDGVNVTGTGLGMVNGILGGWATMQPPTTWATLDGSSNVIGYTAFTDLGTGVPIVSNPASNVRLTSATTNYTLAAAGVTDINTLFMADLGANLTADVGTNNTLRFGAKGGIFNASRQGGTSRVLTIGLAAGVGSVTAGGADNTPGDLYLIETPFIGNTGNQLAMNARITNNGTGVVTVHTFGHINMNNVTNAYSGGTYIHGGRIQTVPSNLGSGPIQIFPGGQLFFNGNGTCSNNIVMAGYGNGETAGNGAIRFGGTGRILAGTVTLVGEAATANGTINGPITGPGGLTVGAGTGNGVGTLILGGTNDYVGDTLINATNFVNGTNATGASSLQMTAGRNNTMPHGAGKGNLILNGTPVAATFNLNNSSQTVNGLNSIGSVANSIVTNATAGNVTLTVGDGDANGSFGGTIANGIGGIALTKIGTGTQTLTGLNTYSNATTVNTGSLVFGGSGSFPSASASITVNSNATLDVSAVSPVTLATASPLTTSNGTIVVALQPSGNAVTVSNLNSLGSTNFVRITSIPSISTYPAQFVAIKYTTLNGTLNFGLGGSLPVSPGTPFAGYISNNVANGSVDLVVTSGPSSFRWVGYSSGLTNLSWDTTTTNWVTFAGGPALYANGSFVRFDNTASNGLVSLDIVASPAGVTVSNGSLVYTIGGGNYISGGGGLSKQGAGTLILDQSGVNDFTGGVTIGGGTLQIGNNDTGGNLPVGSVVDNAALVFRRSDGVTVPNVISGTGTLTQNSASTLVLAAANTFTGAVSVLQGTLQAGNNSALGTTNGVTTVASGATLEIVANAINLGQETITLSGSGVGGAGALVNNSGSLTFVGPNAARAILAGDTTVGGSGRFDLRSATTSNPLLGSLSTQSQPRKLTKVGGGTFGLIGITVDPQLGDIEVQQGIFSLEAAVTSVGNASSNLSVWPGATLQMFAVTNLVNKVITLGGDGATTSVSATSGAGNTIIGPMSITNDCIFSVNNNTVALNLNNVITGPGKMTKIGAGLLTISGNSPAYAGGLQLNNGNVTISGTMSNTLGMSVAAGKFTLNGTLLGAGITGNASTTISGSGTAAGAVDISGTLIPGETNTIGTLTVGELTLQSGANLFFNLVSTNAVGGGFNDLIQVNGNLTVNGNPIAINPVGLLKTGAGNPYRLFNYTGTLIWNADLSVTGPFNYTFTVDTNTVGQVNIVASGGPPVWNGGSSTTSNWTDTNNWSGVTIVSGDSLFFNGPARLSNVNDTPADTTYTDLNFVAGAPAFTLNGNPITLGGNIINNSTSTQTVNLGMSSSVSNTFNGTPGTLIIGGGFTNTSGASTLTLAGAGILTNQLYSTVASGTNIISVVSNANWTLTDNPSSLALTNPIQLDILAGTFNFGTGSSSPKLASSTLANSRIGVVPGAPATFNMAGGTLTIAARLNTGAAAGAIAAINQSGGTINVEDVLQLSDSSANAATTVNLTGGLLNIADEVGLNNVFLASRGTGVVTVAGSGVMNCATLDMSRNAAGNTLGSIGVINLNGGILAASRIGAATSAAQAGGAPTATFNFNGGTLKANASSAIFYQGNASAPAIPIVSVVKSGGAIVDTTNFDITILEPLIHDSGLGATPDGGLTKHGTGTLTLTATSTYTGNTLVSNGTLAVNGVLGVTAVTVGSGGTLAGTGSLGSNVTVNAGGTLSPAGRGVVGVLTVVSNVTLNGSTAMDLSKSTVTNDVLKAARITYGGTLSLTNLAGTLAGTDTFKLFSASVYAGAFTSIDPAIPGSGLVWNTNTLTTDGILRLTATVNTTPTNIISSAAGGNLTLTWPGDHIGWTLQVQTNTRAIGLNTNWFAVTGSAATNQVIVPIDPATPTVFYRLVYP